VTNRTTKDMEKSFTYEILNEDYLKEMNNIQTTYDLDVVNILMK